MKKLIILLTVFILGCINSKEKAKRWIRDAKKPIICKFHSKNSQNDYINWTLIDAEGNMFSTGYIPLILPDTIKSNY